MAKCIYKNRFGKSGELLAQDHLAKKGLTFIRGNYRYARAEIDLIFKDERRKVLIFVEVKTRRSKAFGEPEESITLSKQANIRRAAEGFAAEYTEYAGYDLRIDVVTVLFENEEAIIDHFENAF